ncbi:MAG: hypothetical protein ACJAVM_000535 [Sulfitobacter sp.]|jgi:hypothetical protein
MATASGAGNNATGSVTLLTVQQAVGATVWSSDRVFLGQVIAAKSAPGGRVDARLRLSADLAQDGTALIRLNPDWIRNGKFRMQMSSGSFLSQISN